MRFYRSSGSLFALRLLLRAKRRRTGCCRRINLASGSVNGKSENQKTIHGARQPVGPMIFDE